jgi:lipopolysaccharide biosynthesis glycosyltransferase
MSERGIVHVAVATDGAYVLPLGAMLVSLCAHFEPGRGLRVHALGDRLAPRDWSRLEACVTGAEARFERIEVDAAQLLGPEFRTRSFEHISPVCFLRLLLPELLPGLRRVIYLDGDMIVCADIGELWDLELGGACFAAALELHDDGTPALLAAQLRHATGLGVPADAPVRNVGALVMDLDAWRRTRLAARAFAYLRAGAADVRWYEQEALNVCAQGAMATLEPRWNAPPRQAVRLDSSRRGIVHFLTARKPWHWGSDLPLAGSFFAAVDASPWRGWRPARPALGHLARFAAALRKAIAKRTHARRARRARPPRGRGDAEHGRIATAAGTWLLLLRPGERLVDAAHHDVDPGAEIARCERDGFEAVEAAEALDAFDGGSVEAAPAIHGWAARDLDDRLFLGRARVLPPRRACDVPRFATRIVLVREQPGLRLDEARTVIAGARVAPRVLRISRSGPSP